MADPIYKPILDNHMAWLQAQIDSELQHIHELERRRERMAQRYYEAEEELKGLRCVVLDTSGETQDKIKGLERERATIVEKLRTDIPNDITRSHERRMAHRTALVRLEAKLG